MTEVFTRMHRVGAHFTSHPAATACRAGTISAGRRIHAQASCRFDLRQYGISARVHNLPQVSGTDASTGRSTEMGTDTTQDVTVRKGTELQKAAPRRMSSPFEEMDRLFERV